MLRIKLFLIRKHLPELESKDDVKHFEGSARAYICMAVQKATPQGDRWHRGYSHNDIECAHDSQNRWDNLRIYGSYDGIGTTRYLRT